MKEETKKKISNSLKGRTFTDEHLVKLKNAAIRNAKFGKDNFHWKEKKKCIDCEKQIDRRSTRCARCGYKVKGRYDFSIGKNNHKWKGNSVGYYGIHVWINRQLKRKGFCSKCLQKRKTQLSNIPKTYKRKLSDWIELCVPCHKKIDLLKMKKHKFSGVIKKHRLKYGK